MNSWIVVLVLASGPEASAATVSSPEVLKDVQGQLQTGSLIFSQGDCLAVKLFSQSPYTHVGGVVVHGDQVTVYDSMNGTGVRKTPLKEYLRLQTPCEIRVVHPSRPLSESQAKAYEQHLESQLGRKYAIKHHVTGGRCEGLHCSEYMTDALMAAQLIQAKQPSRVSPGSLLTGLEQAKLCTDGGCYRLKEVTASPPKDQTWCQRTWHDTVACCTNCGTQLRRWVLCH